MTTTNLRLWAAVAAATVALLGTPGSSAAGTIRHDFAASDDVVDGNVLEGFVTISVPGAPIEWGAGYGQASAWLMARWFGSNLTDPSLFQVGWMVTAATPGVFHPFAEYHPGGTGTWATALDMADVLTPGQSYVFGMHRVDPSGVWTAFVEIPGQDAVVLQTEYAPWITGSAATRWSVAQETTFDQERAAVPRTAFGPWFQIARGAVTENPGYSS